MCCFGLGVTLVGSILSGETRICLGVSFLGRYPNDIYA